MEVLSGRRHRSVTSGIGRIADILALIGGILMVIGGLLWFVRSIFIALVSPGFVIGIPFEYSGSSWE